MSDSAAERDGLLADLQGLVRLTQVPHRDCQYRAVADAGVLAGEFGPGARPGAVIERQSTSAMGLGGGELSATHRRDGGEEQRLHEHAGVVRPLGERHRFGSQGGQSPSSARTRRQTTVPHMTAKSWAGFPIRSQSSRARWKIGPTSGRSVAVRRHVRRAERIEEL